MFNQGKNCCLNSSTVDLFLTNGPQSTSTMNIVHLSQSKFVSELDNFLLWFLWRAFSTFFFSLRLYMTYYSFGVWKFMWSKGLRCNITRRMSLYILFLMSFYTVEVWNWKLYVTLLMLFLSTSPRIILFR